MDKNKLLMAGIAAILIIVLIIVALFFVNVIWEKGSPEQD